MIYSVCRPRVGSPTVRIPFTIPDVSDTDEAEGFVYVEDDYFVIEYEIKKLGLFRQGAQFVKVDRAVIVGLEVKHRLFSDRLIIETTSMQLMREIPGKHVAGVEVRTARKHREAVRQFVERVHAWIDGVPMVPHGPRP